jgi:hypothetical protein
VPTSKPEPVDDGTGHHDSEGAGSTGDVKSADSESHGASGRHHSEDGTDASTAPTAAPRTGHEKEDQHDAAEKSHDGNHSGHDGNQTGQGGTGRVRVAGDSGHNGND